MRLTQLKIKQRIGLGFGISLCLMLFLAGSAWLTMSHVDERVQTHSAFAHDVRQVR
ncbi:MAG: hypothetical protein ACE366_14740 [Bradymonadia bacterium]